MNGQYFEQSYPNPYPSDSETSSESWAGYVALTLIILLIIAVIVYVIWNGTATILAPKWNIINSGTATADVDTFTGTPDSFYIVKTTSPTLTLSVIRPSGAAGYSFIIDNSKTGTEVTLTGGASGTISEGQSVMFIWTSATEATRITN